MYRASRRRVTSVRHQLGVAPIRAFLIRDQMLLIHRRLNISQNIASNYKINLRIMRQEQKKMKTENSTRFFLPFLYKQISACFHPAAAFIKMINGCLMMFLACTYYYKGGSLKAITKFSLWENRKAICRNFILGRRVSISEEVLIKI